MRYLDTVKRLSFESRLPMLEIARGLGVSPQSLYRSLRSGLTLEKFVRIVGLCGFRLLVVDKSRNIVCEIRSEE